MINTNKHAAVSRQTESTIAPADRLLTAQEVNGLLGMKCKTSTTPSRSFTPVRYYPARMFSPDATRQGLTKNRTLTGHLK